MIRTRELVNNMKRFFELIWLVTLTIVLLTLSPLVDWLERQCEEEEE